MAYQSWARLTAPRRWSTPMMRKSCSSPFLQPMAPKCSASAEYASKPVYVIEQFRTFMTY